MDKSKLEHISTSLFDQSTELHHVKGALNNLHKVLQAQKSQHDAHYWEVLTMNMVKGLEERKSQLEASVQELTTKQAQAYQSQYGANK